MPTQPRRVREAYRNGAKLRSLIGRGSLLTWMRARRRRWGARG